MYSYRSNTSPVLAEEHSSLLCEVVEDSIGNAAGIDDVISIKHFHVVPLVAIEPKTLVKGCDLACDWAIFKLYLRVFGWIVKIDGNLRNDLHTCFRSYLIESTPSPSTGDYTSDSPRSIFRPSVFSIMEACMLLAGSVWRVRSATCGSTSNRFSVASTLTDSVRSTPIYGLGSLILKFQLWFKNKQYKLWTALIKMSRKELLDLTVFDDMRKSEMVYRRP